MKIVWTYLAETTLENIYLFYSQSGTSIATEVYNNILAEVKLLSEFPFLGSFADELQNISVVFRKYHVVRGRFRVTYFIDNNLIVIAAVTDNRQHPDVLRKLLLETGFR